MNKLKKLIQERAAFLKKLNALIDAADSEKRDLTEEESNQVNELTSSIEAHDVKIKAERSRQALISAQTELDDYANSVTGPTAPPPVGGDLSDGERRDISQYRFIKAFREQLNGRLTGIEAEMHQEAEKDAMAAGQALDGLGVPQIILAQSRFSNDLTVTGGDGGSQGGVTVPTELRSVIDILREKLMVRAMGATVLSDLRGVIDFPRMITDSDPTEKGENEAADENSPTVGAVRLTPHRLPVVAEVSKQLLMQSSVDVEAWLRDYLGFRMASRMDKNALNGTGADNQPLGLLNVSGIGSVAIGTNGGAPTRDHLIDLVSEVAIDNADVGRLGFLTTPGVRGKLQKTKVDAGSGIFIWGEQSNSLVGYRAEVSTNVPSTLTKGTLTDGHAIIYGNWASLMIGQWGGLDVLLNPYSKDSQGLIRVNMATFYDIGVDHEESFSACLDADIS